MTYQVTAMGTITVTDDGGSATAPSLVIPWSAAAVARLNATWADGLVPVKAVATFGMGGSMRMVIFTVIYLPATVS